MSLESASLAAHKPALPTIPTSINAHRSALYNATDKTQWTRAIAMLVETRSLTYRLV